MESKKDNRTEKAKKAAPIRRSVLCSFNRTGSCKNNPCNFKHSACILKDDCKLRECMFGHSSLWEEQFQDVDGGGKSLIIDEGNDSGNSTTEMITVQVVGLNDSSSLKGKNTEDDGDSSIICESVASKKDSRIEKAKNAAPIKSVLCSFNRTGSCKKNPCNFKHSACSMKDDCKLKMCKFGHSSLWEEKFQDVDGGGKSLTIDKGNDSGNSTTEMITVQASSSKKGNYEDDDVSSIDCESVTSSTVDNCENGKNCREWNCRSKHPPGWKGQCIHGEKCIKYLCEFIHPAERPPKCSQECVDYYCENLHQTVHRCRNGVKCSRLDCHFLHPNERVFCDTENCKDILCLKIHLFKRRPVCQFGSKCMNVKCTSLHPTSRPEVCPLKTNCAEFACQLLHSQGRTYRCKFRDNCRNKDCAYLHPNVDCPHGVHCENIVNQTCFFRHPLICNYGLRCKNESCERYHPDGWDPNNNFPGMNLKTFNARNDERNTTRQLPIFKCYSEFLSRLDEHKVLIVTAATGSGKTTQLPQYAAEKFGGLVVCTQPRALAAITLADRIAQEFDGETVGYNVGYKVGGGQPKDGKLIMLMTDASLVRMAQQDSLLSTVKVLIIDEAHERSLNTDLVVGIAKRIRQKRPNDFHVVIASATIDPEPFLNFFFGPKSPVISAARRPLDVEGRMFPVHIADPVIPKDRFVKVVEELLIPTVVKSLKEYDEGHCLVFLPGSGEVDKAIRQFRNNVNFQENWEPMPLYGGMPPEEQTKIFEFPDDGMNGAARMIVFCTNIAETSLTVPNVKLVIDTGLAKEARFDPQRRMTVLEEVLVCKSSADQRKGRAGRTAAGACVRLFDYDNLPRQNIEPELLRSSLDKVVLQLCILGGDYHPKHFSFMDAPPEENLQASILLLRYLGCLDDNDKVTDKGKCFNELPFDPRLSNFVMTMYDGYGMLELGAEIASVLTAPGSIHFMGGSDKTAKKNKQDQLAEASKNFDSDLLHLHNTYLQWKTAGDNIINNQCRNLNCNRKVSFGGCSRCRSSLARVEGLNNKICETVYKTAEEVKKVIKKWMKQEKVLSEFGNIDVTEAIGRSLVSNFREQIGELLMPTLPDSGVYLISSGLKGSFSSQSCFLHNTGGANVQFVVAMSLTQTPSGKLMLKDSHPLKFEWMPVDLSSEVASLTLDMVECYQRTNINSRYRRIVQKYFDEHVERRKEIFDASGGMDEKKGIPEAFLLTSYDKRDSILLVHAPRQDACRLATITQMVIDEQIRQDIDYETNVVISGGNAVVTAVGGFMISSVQQAGVQLKIRFNQLPTDKGIKSEETLMAWLLREAMIARGDVKWLCFRPCMDPEEQLLSSGYGIVVLKNAEAAEKVLIIAGRLEQALGKQSTTSQDFSREEEWGRKVQIQWRGSVKYADLQRALELPEAANIYIHPTKNEPNTLFLQYLMQTITESHLLQFLPSNTRPKIRFDEIPNKQKLKNAYLVFPDKSTMDAAEYVLKTSPLCQKNANGKGVVVMPPKSRIVRIDLTFKSSELASELCKIMSLNPLPECTSCKGIASVEICKSELFPNLNEMINEIKRKFAVDSSMTNSSRDKGRIVITFSSTDPVKCGKAAQQLQSQTRSLFIKLKDRKQQLMLYELKESGLLRKWAEEGSLVEETKAFNNKGKNFIVDPLIFSLTVSGPISAQGEFMAKISEYSNSFDTRYKHYPLGSEIIHFRSGREGAKRLDAIDDGLGDSGKISFLYHLQVIEVVLSIDVDDAPTVMNHVESQLLQLLNELGVSKQSLSTMNKSNSCVFCQGNISNTFTICGHGTCNPCFSRSSQNATTFPICCPRENCQVPIAIQDFKTILDPKVFEIVCSNSTLKFLRDNKAHPLGCCPVIGCSGILSKENRYSLCYLCNNYVCAVCGAKNDPLHIDKSCKAYRRITLALKVFDADLLFKEACTFVMDNWIEAEIGKITEIKENPGIRNGCPSMQKFCKGIINIGGLSAYRGSSFFAWHGTSSNEAISGICHHGFDPHRRSGQLHGPGEYFGHSYQVSHSYARGTGKMIVAQLLYGPMTHTNGNFCHIVNNPLDWKISYNLPVLVLSYGNSPTTPVTFQVSSTEPLPFKLQDDIDTEFDDFDDYEDEMDSGAGVVVRWHWRADDHKFYPYNDEINSLIESKFGELRALPQYQQNFLTPEIVRYIDDKPQCYKIDFGLMTQFNASTNYPRDLQRQLPPKAKTVGLNMEQCIWEFYDAAKKWRPYDSLCQNHIESVYMAYIQGESDAVAEGVRFPGRPETYSLTFTSPMKQTNLLTKKIRAIRRVSAADRNLKAKHFGETIQMLIKTKNSNASNGTIDFADQGNIANQIRSHVKTIVLNGLGKNCDDWDLPILSFHDSMIDLTFTGLTKSLAGIIVGKIRSFLSLLYDCDAELVTTEFHSGLELRKWLSDNPRLLQMATNQSPFSVNRQPSTREEVVLLVAHTVIWQLGFKVYGGFVRDWAIRGEPANDIDSVAPSSVNLRDVGRRIGMLLEPYGVLVADEKPTGAAWTIVMRKESWTTDIKTVDLDMIHDNFKSQAPGVDCDCGNLSINSTGQLVKKSESAGGSQIPLVKCIRHCSKKKFIFFYSLVDNLDVAKRRLKKYFDRGWICIGMCTSCLQVDEAKRPLVDIVDPKYHKSIQLKQKYCRPWNVIT